MSREDVLATMRAADVFRSFDESTLVRLAGLAEEREFRAGEHIFVKGEQAESWFCIILAGRADVLSSDGEICAVRGAGEVIGEIGPVSQSKIRFRTVEAADDVCVARWNIDTIQAEEPHLYQPLMQALKGLAWSRANPLIRKIAGDD